MLTESKTLNDKESMTYDYYQRNVKPNPKAAEKQGFRCNICGYVYEGETLPPDFICPICKHGVADFVKI
jgi:rubrerythrin